MEKLYKEKHSSLLDWSIIKKSTMIYTLVVTIIKHLVSQMKKSSKLECLSNVTLASLVFTSNGLEKLYNEKHSSLLWWNIIENKVLWARHQLDWIEENWCWHNIACGFGFSASFWVHSSAVSPNLSFIYTSDFEVRFNTAFLRSVSLLYGCQGKLMVDC